MSPFAQIETITVPASKSDEKERSQQEEAEALSKRLAANDGAYIVAMSHRGTQMSSEDFAELFLKQRDFGSGRMLFMIGGSHGLHESLLKKADFILSFSKMTFTHEMVRVFLKEQLYRAATILAGKRYHK